MKTFEEKSVVLLQGVTGSGKTEVYMEIIARVISKGEQVLYLLPEISLTPQMVERLQGSFGEEVTVYHSKFSVHERREVWNNVKVKNAKAKKRPTKRQPAPTELKKLQTLKEVGRFAACRRLNILVLLVLQDFARAKPDPDGA